MTTQHADISAQKHVAKTGARAGQWVTCGAATRCRNGGMHISAEQLSITQHWLALQNIKKPLKQLTLTDVERFRKAEADGYDNSEEAQMLLQQNSDTRTFKISLMSEADWDYIIAYADEKDIISSSGEDKNGLPVITFAGNIEHSKNIETMVTAVQVMGSEKFADEVHRRMNVKQLAEETYAPTQAVLNVDDFKRIYVIARQHLVKVNFSSYEIQRTGILGLYGDQVVVVSGLEITGHPKDVEAAVKSLNFQAFSTT